MDQDNTLKLMKEIKKTLGGIILISFLVGLKLILSFFVPGLKTPGELVWTGTILILYTARAFFTYIKLK